jgi:hypothetical protein
MPEFWRPGSDWDVGFVEAPSRGSVVPHTGAVAENAHPTAGPSAVSEGKTAA